MASTDSRAVRTAEATPTTSARANTSGTSTVAPPVSGNGRTFAANHEFNPGSAIPVPLVRASWTMMLRDAKSSTRLEVKARREFPPRSDGGSTGYQGD